MEGNNAGAEVTKAEVSSTLNQPAVSSVPDVINNVPAATAQALATTCASAKSVSAPTPLKTADGSAQLSAAATPIPTTAVKPVPAPPQPNQNIPRATSLPSAASEASVKNRSSREEKARKKDDKSVEHIMRALNSLNTPEEKLAAMYKKYAEQIDEHRKLQVLQKQTEKRCSVLQREKEQLTGEQSKAILTRSRLENLCRELQRQNKAIKDESLLKIREEEEKRKDVSAKFQTTMNEITSLMQQNNDKNMKLRDDNIDMTAKLKSICEQYELRQQQVDRISKQMQLEQQLADAKLSKLKLEMAAERETLLKEKQQLLLELQQYQHRCTEFQGTEVNLRNQISMYNDKYDEFQKALARSNDVFGGFKGEMEKMSKKICKLEKETSSWKQRWERSHNALLEMGADKQKSEQELVVVSRQLATLQGLCRTLQAERATLTAKLKILQAGEQDSLEKNVVNYLDKVNKQTKLDQTLNHVEPVELSDKSSNCMVKSDPLFKHCTQDILSSIENIVAVEDSSVCHNPSPTVNRAAIPTAESVHVPTLANPLPDVVGVSSVCISEQKPDVNSDLAQQFQNITFGSNIAVDEKSNSTLKTNVSGLAEVPSADQPSKPEVSNQPSVIVENKVPQVISPPALNTVPQVISTPALNTVPQVIGTPALNTVPQVISTPALNTVPQVISTPVLNGDAKINGLLKPDQNIQKGVSTPPNQPSKSPTLQESPAKSPEIGKRTKEPAKKKKK